MAFALALYVFMADAIRVAPHGVDAIQRVLPTTFNWPLFGIALTLMSAPVAINGLASAPSRRQR